jgi:peptidoglycan/LPS O-acetylase OafA/YrhL
MQQRIFYPQVESLRGIACLAVVVFHLFKAPDRSTITNRTAENLLNLAMTTVFNGTGAVMLFFVISGFVLGVNLKGALTPASYAQFMVRRAFRLMPAVWVSILFAGLARHVSLSPSDFWLGDSVLKVNGPLWSIQVEVIASILFPFMFFGSRGMGVFGSVVLLLILSRFSYAGDLPYISALYLFAFQLGILVPTVGPYIARKCGLVGFAASLFALCVATNVSNLGFLRPTEHSLMEGFASFVIVSCVVYGGRWNAFLMRQDVRFVGRISFSVYLLHYPLIAIVHDVLAPTTANTFLLGLFMAPIAIPLTILCAWAMYRLIEKPTNDVGRFMGTRLVPAS